MKIPVAAFSRLNAWKWIEDIFSILTLADRKSPVESANEKEVDSCPVGKRFSGILDTAL